MKKVMLIFFATVLLLSISHVEANSGCAATNITRRDGSFSPTAICPFCLDETAADGLVRLKSPYEPSLSIERLISGISLYRNTTLLFVDDLNRYHGNPSSLPGETKVLEFEIVDLYDMVDAAPLFGLELPLRFLVWSNSTGSYIGFIDPIFQSIRIQGTKYTEAFCRLQIFMFSVAQLAVDISETGDDGNDSVFDSVKTVIGAVLLGLFVIIGSIIYSKYSTRRLQRRMKQRVGEEVLSDGDAIDYKQFSDIEQVESSGESSSDSFETNETELSDAIYYVDAGGGDDPIDSTEIDNITDMQLVASTPPNLIDS